MYKYNDFQDSDIKDPKESAILSAYNMSLLSYSNNEILNILSNNDDEIKPIALINIKSIDSKEEFDLILSHLTGQDGRIREAASYVLSEFVPDNYVTDEKSIEILVNGIGDINPNVVRNVISFIEKSDSLKKTMFLPIVCRTRRVLTDLSVFIKEGSPFVSNQTKSSKNHAKNKLTFNLYWLLEAISVLIISENIDDILEKCANFLDYTIREKAALIISKMENPPFELLQKLKNDENMYVKNQLL